MAKQTQKVTTPQELSQALARCRAAQEVFATFSQEQVDRIFLAAASAANKARIPLARLAVRETGMGVVEDKVIKNHYASEYIYNAYKHEKTCGVLEEAPSFGIQKIAEPIGVVAAVIPTTNPTSTAIFRNIVCTIDVIYAIINTLRISTKFQMIKYTISIKYFKWINIYIWK